MNSLSLSITYLRHKLLGSFLTLVTFASGIGVIVALLLINTQLNNEFTKNLRGIDLVVGGKGSPMQLILSSVFHLDVPNGNIPLEEADKLKQHPLVKTAIPVALGDNYNGFRIVGTTPDYIKHYNGKLQPNGHFWQKEMEAVLGAEVAEKNQLTIGDKFVGSHGLSAGGEVHGETPYTVVGILAPTGSVIDRLALTGVESVWHIHEAHQHHHDEDEADEDHHHEVDHDEFEEHGHHHDEVDHDETDHGHDEHEHENDHEEREITSLLISYKTPMAAAVLPREVNNSSSMQAASPAFEVARLTSFMGVGADTLRSFGWYLIVLAGFGVFVALYNAMNERRYDLALMRSFGASPTKLFGLIVSESLTLSLGGAFIGLALGHGFVELASIWLAQTKHIHITGALFLPEEGWLLLASAVIGVVAALLPALRVYRIDIFKTLVRT